MHPDPCFHPEDRARSLAACRALVEQVGFAMIFADVLAGPRVVHAPVVWFGESALRFHIARRNLIADHLDGMTALCVVNGPNGYISPRWYADASNVPTWNYVAAELEGRVSQLDESSLRAQIAMLIDASEARIPHGSAWTLDQASPADVDAMIPAIVGFELDIRDWRYTAKLSQNKSAGDRERVASGLDVNGNAGIARRMRDEAA
jgi:transcriptional regulator